MRRNGRIVKAQHVALLAAKLWNQAHHTDRLRSANESDITQPSAGSGDRGRILDYAIIADAGGLPDLSPGYGRPSVLITPMVPEVARADGSKRRVDLHNYPVTARLACSGPHSSI